MNIILINLNDRRKIMTTCNRLCRALLFGVVSINAVFGADSVLPAATGPVAASLQSFVDNHALAGAVVLAASRDKILCLEAVGYADIAAKKPMQINDLFWIASMSKAITATGLMMLVDEGKVNVDDPVEKYLPEFKGQMLAVKGGDGKEVLSKPIHPITVKEILTHTSGLPFKSNAEGSGMVYTADGLPLKDAVANYAKTPLEFEPGSKYQYSNAGINTAGRIIEVVSGTPYEEFMQKRLFGPLGMTDTTFWPTEEQVQRLAKSYKPNAEGTDLEETPIRQLTYPLTDRRRGPSPAGGYFSTATDISIFCRMFLNGGVYEGRRYLSEEAVTQMTSIQTDDLVPKRGYGFGWWVNRPAALKNGTVPARKFGHPGAYSTSMDIDLQRQLVTVYMVQHEKYGGKDGGKIHPAFEKAVYDKLGKLQPTLSP